MTLNHLNLPVPDVAAASAFFTRFFGFEPEPSKGATSLAVLRDASGFVLVLMPLPATSSAAYPKAFHVGFICATPAEVEQKHQQLVAAGFNSHQGPALMRDSFVFYFQALGFLLIEVSATVAQ
jgi:catechol 2,3-dioxygenase-like lactoylglutathione lyase family enzyme